MVNREELVENLDKAKFMCLTLMKLHKYLQKVKMRHVITSDCGNIEFRFYPDNSIHIQIFYTAPPLTNSSYRAAIFNYQEENFRNSVGAYSIYYSQLYKICSVGYFFDYNIEYPYEHSEEQYFQNLTRYDLPEEFYYEETCKFLQEIKDLEAGSLEVNMRGLNKEHIESINKLLDRMELNDVEYY